MENIANPSDFILIGGIRQCYSEILTHISPLNLASASSTAHVAVYFVCWRDRHATEEAVGSKSCISRKHEKTLN